MAVSTKENGIKILANPDGIRLLRTMENSRSFDPSRVASASAAVVKVNSFLSSFYSLYLGLYLLNALLSATQSSAMNTFGAVNPSAGPSIMDRATPIPAMVAMVRYSVLRES